MHWLWAACALAVLLAGAEHRHVQRNAELDGGFRRPILALEVAETVPRADAAVGSLGGAGRVRKGVYVDYGFIVFYVALFALLGWMLCRDVPLDAWRWLAVAGIVCAAAAGALDFLENARILAFVDAPAAADRAPLVDALRAASLLKWGAFFLAVAFLAAPLLRQGGACAALGALFLLVAAAGAYGVAAHRPAIEWAFTLALAAAVPSAAAIWALWPRR